MSLEQGCFYKWKQVLSLQLFEIFLSILQMSYNNIYHLVFKMDIKRPDLDSLVADLYGSSLKKYMNIKTAYSTFTPFRNTETDQVIYFYLLRVAAKHHLSEGSIHFALRKYHPFLQKVQLLLIDINFNEAFYLVRSYNYLTSIDELITLQKECHEVMEKEYILKTIEFLISIYKARKSAQFPELTPKSLGINEQGHLKICDYQFYFKKQFQMRSLTENICSCLNPMIKMALARQPGRFLDQQDQIQKLVEYYGQSFAHLIKVLVLDPMQDMQRQGVLNGKGKQINIKKIQEALENYYKTAQEDVNTTLNQTFQEDIRHEKHHSNQYCQSDLITNDTLRSIRQPFLLPDQDRKQKRKKTIKIASVFIVIMLIVAGALFFFNYYAKEIICNVCQFKPADRNICLSCSQGCLRCQSQHNMACYSCSGKMYLVLNDQKDTMGACQVTCVGTILRSNICLRNKTPKNIQDQKPNLIN